MKNWILSRKKAVVIVCGLTILIIVITIFIQKRNSIEAMQAEDTFVTANQTAEIEAWGEVRYSHIENISIDIPAVVTDVTVKEGERVMLGQPLVTLDLSEYNGNIEKLKQQLSADQAALPAAAQDISALQADIAQMQSEIARKNEEYNNSTNADLQLLQNSLNLAQKELENTKNDLQNYQSLYDAQAVPETTLNQYKTALDQCQKAVDDVKATIQKTKTALKDELNQLNISLKSKETQLSQLQLGNSANVTKQQSGISATQVDLNIMMSKTAKDYFKDNQIVSNVKNGIVQNIAVSDGDYLGVQGMPTKVLQIIDADSITVSAEVYEEFIGSVQVGESVRIVPTSAPDTSLTGTVTQIPDLAVEKDGRRVVRVLVKPDDPNGLLKPGFTADVYFTK
jgi:multidrug resistance efflux pump